jgi:putative transposase
VDDSNVPGNSIPSRAGVTSSAGVQQEKTLAQSNQSTGSPGATDREIQILCEKFGVTGAGKKRIQLIRSSEPSRRIAGAKGAFTGNFPSNKNCFTVQWKGKDFNRKRVLQHEYDDSVLAYFDEPPDFKITYETMEGKQTTVRANCTYFVIGQSFLGYEDLYSEAEIRRNTQASPNRFKEIKEGSWTDLVIQSECTALGLGFRIVTPHDVPQVLTRNYDLLRNYLDRPIPNLPELGIERLKAALIAATNIPLPKAIYIAGSADLVYWGIRLGLWVIDIARDDLANPDSVMVHQDWISCESYRWLVKTQLSSIARSPAARPREMDCFIWDGDRWRLEVEAQSSVTIQRQRDGKTLTFSYLEFDALCQSPKLLFRPGDLTSKISKEGLDRLVTASMEAKQKASRQLKSLSCRWDGEPDPFDTSERTLRDWQDKYDEGVALYGSGYLGLLDKCEKRGNRTSRISQSDEDCLERYFAEKLIPGVNKTLKDLYSDYTAYAPANGSTTMGFDAFQRRKAKRDQYQDAKTIQGEKAAYPLKPAIKSEKCKEPPEGDRYLGKAHIDHTQSNVYARVSDRLELVARPWITLLICAFTRLVLGWWIGFQPPSQISCLMALRDVVRRIRKLPAQIIFDGGKEFGATAFMQLLALYHSEGVQRPLGEARFGNPVERMNLNLDNWVCRNALGNNQFVDNRRLSTPSLDPKILTNLVLVALARRYGQVLFEAYPNREHTALGCTPNERRDESLLLHGERKHCEVESLDVFLQQTRITPKRHRGAIDPRTGVRVNAWDYYHDDFKGCLNERLRGKPTFDFEDPRSILANLRGVAIECDLIGSQAARLSGADLKYATTERLLKIHNHQLATAEDVRRRGALHASWDAEDAIAAEDRAGAAQKARGNDPSPTLIVPQSPRLIVATPTILPIVKI